MNLSEIFIRRPIATSLLMVAIALFGVLSYRALPVAICPPSISPRWRSAALPGATPATMASAVATPLERQFTGISGLDSMTSVSTLGTTQITLQFDLSRNIDGAAVDVETAINEATAAAAPGHAQPAVVPQEQPRRFAHRVHGRDVDDAAHVGARRLCRDDHRAAHLHHQRRGAGDGVRGAEVRRPRAGGSRTSWPRADRHQ